MPENVPARKDRSASTVGRVGTWSKNAKKKLVVATAKTLDTWRKTVLSKPEGNSRREE